MRRTLYTKLKGFVHFPVTPAIPMKLLVLYLIVYPTIKWCASVLCGLRLIYTRKHLVTLVISLWFLRILSADPDWLSILALTGFIKVVSLRYASHVILQRTVVVAIN